MRFPLRFAAAVRPVLRCASSGVGLAYALIGLASLAPALAAPASPAVAPASPAVAPAPAEVTALVLARGVPRGSGILIRQGAAGTWLVTNRHVIDGLDRACVRSADGRLWPGTVAAAIRPASLDLAFVWLPAAASGAALPVAVPAGRVAMLGASRRAWPQGFPIVRATGYPEQEESAATPPAYRELPGLLLPQLPRPLEGGLQLVTTAPVRKGMSGGGLFNAEGQLIGLNATHADPLWSAPLREEGGTILPADLTRQLELVSMAIPVTRILPLLAGLPVAGPPPQAGARGATANPCGPLF